MNFRIADTFTDSLAKLTGQEQKAAKTTAFDLQLDPSGHGKQFHKVNRAKDPNFWSVRVSRGLRIIAHRSADSLLLCYVAHHDPAYDWAERRKIERHPKTGAAQLVEVRERVEEVVVQKPVASPAPAPQKPRPFATTSDEDLLAYGVPPEWLEDVREADEDAFLELADRLPGEAAEALLKLAAGEKPEPPVVADLEDDPFSHPDALRRFRVLTNVEELERALEFPWEKWTVFLHPAQRAFVERDYGGPARISGSAGTGKTIVALHRAVRLARQQPEARILLTSFSHTLSNVLKIKLDRLVGNEPQVQDRIDVHSVPGLGRSLYEEQFDTAKIVSDETISTLLAEAASQVPDHGFPEQFLLCEWSEVVDAWQLKTWEDYRDVVRLGRKTRVGGKQRELLWAIFAKLRSALEQRGLQTWPDLFTRLADHFATSSELPYDAAVIDEAQDLGVAPLRFLASLGRGKPDGLFFTGDLGQRIFQTPFSWKALGVDIRGRSHTLRVNYRTSHQIRAQADRLLPLSLADVDGNLEDRRGTVSVFNGPPPTIKIFEDTAAETEAVATWIAERLAEGTAPEEVGLFVRSKAQLERAVAAAKRSATRHLVLGDEVETAPGHLSLSTMHLAKGLEFRAVAVMACDDEVLPLQERIETVTDESELEEVYNTERHLLYVACTRARDRLLITGVDPASEFLDDLSA